MSATRKSKNEAAASVSLSASSRWRCSAIAGSSARSSRCSTAKVLVKFAEQNDKLKITGGVLDGTVMPAATVNALSKLPSREVLLAQLLGLINAPASQLLRTIQEPGAQVARLLGALERSKREAGGASASAADQSASTTIEAENQEPGQEPVKEDSSHD